MRCSKCGDYLKAIEDTQVIYSVLEDGSLYVGEVIDDVGSFTVRCANYKCNAEFPEANIDWNGEGMIGAKITELGEPL